MRYSLGTTLLHTGDSLLVPSFITAPMICCLARYLSPRAPVGLSFFDL